jgi:hypothetical protein
VSPLVEQLANRGIPVIVEPRLNHSHIVDLGDGPVVVTPSLEVLQKELGDRVTDIQLKLLT